MEKTLPDRPRGVTQIRISMHCGLVAHSKQYGNGNYNTRLFFHLKDGGKFFTELDYGIAMHNAIEKANIVYQEKLTARSQLATKKPKAISKPSLFRYLELPR